MKVTVCKREIIICHSKCCIIFLFLAVFVIISLLQNIPQFQQKTIVHLKDSIDPKPRHFCTFEPLSHEDALEERLLLDSIAWPETPLLSDSFSIEQTSDPAHSTFTILPESGGEQWHLGDQLKVLIKMSDFRGFPKKYGGDVLFVQLRNPTLSAGVVGKVVDHLNGSYTAVFTLLWEGSAQVEVTLVHPSEAVTVLRRLTREQPDRISFQSVFRSGSLPQQTTICNVCLRPTQQPVCNYTDLHTGDPWFCYKPKNLSCDARISHSRREFEKNLPVKEEKLFQSHVNMKVFIKAAGPASVNVLPKEKGQPNKRNNNEKPELSGYYYQGVWRSLSGSTVRQFNTSSDITLCLKGKTVHLYGDSTVRQWFQTLNAALPDLTEFNLHINRQGGPFMALDQANNILVMYRCHGPPIRFAPIPTHELRYIANELNHLIGGTNTVVVIGMWSHFSTFPIEIYIRRLQGIRKAVVRLLDRAPGTRVVIRTANPKALTLPVALTNSDWDSLQRDKVLRAMFKGLDVHWVDAWEMSLAHQLPHDLHPKPPIIKNMINVLLSYICT